MQPSAQSVLCRLSAISAINIGPPTLSLDKLPAITWPIKEKVRSISPPPLRIARSSAVITPIRTVFWLAISKDMRTLGDTPKRQCAVRRCEHRLKLPLPLAPVVLETATLPPFPPGGHARCRTHRSNNPPPVHQSPR